MSKPILEIDAKGWSRIQSTQAKHRLFFELYQNAKDESSTKNIKFSITAVPNSPFVDFQVTDDGPGFADLSHAYTLFATSQKLGNPYQNGFMNMGEKSVIVAAKWMTIETTSGTVEFDMVAGTRSESPRKRREQGTVVSGSMRMTRKELDETVEALHSLIVPPHIRVTVNDVAVEHRSPTDCFPAKLPTRLLEDNELVTRTQETIVEVYPVRPGESASLYEMGIPVVGHDIGYHVSVGQKVLLNKDRDNVTPAYLQTLRVLVLNHMAPRLTTGEASESWVRDASGDERAEMPAVEKVLNLRFGEKRVSFSIQDPEANSKAVAEGFTLIHGRSLSEGERENAKKFGLLPVSHAVFPSPKPYSDDPTATPVDVLSESEYSEGMAMVVKYAKFLGKSLLGKNIRVRIVRAPNFRACYGPECGLDFSLTVLGRRWFDAVTEDTDSLIIHEFGHEYEMNHLSENYYRSLCSLGAKLKKLALQQPEAFHSYTSMG